MQTESIIKTLKELGFKIDPLGVSGALKEKLITEEQYKEILEKINDLHKELFK